METSSRDNGILLKFAFTHTITCTPFVVLRNQVIVVFRSETEIVIETLN